VRDADTRYRPGDLLHVTTPDGAAYTMRVDAVRETDFGFVVAGAVSSPRRYRHQLITVHVDAEGHSPWIEAVTRWT
jgi:hypothetical protein